MIAPVFKKFAIFAALVLLALIAAPRAFAATPEVSELRLGEQPNDILRLVVESDAALEPHVSLLTEPNRVVVDLPAVEWEIGKGAAEGRGFVSGYRYGLFAPGHSRLVLDLEAPALVSRQFTIAPTGRFGHRLVIDLKRTNDAEFLAAVKAKRPLRAAEREPEVVAVPRGEQRKPLIVIDAGHGGNDPGTQSANGKFEKILVLEAAKTIAQRLEASGKFRALLTRDTDIYLPHRHRVEIARANDADLFISIHADSIENPKHRGATVYTLSERASDSEAAALAAKENKSDIIAGVDLGGESKEVTDILIELAQRETMNYSARFAGILIDSMGRQKVIPRRPHRFAGFLVLKAPDVPSVLFEVGYLSNREDTRWIASEAGRTYIADAVTRAAESYFADRLAQQF